MGIKQIMYEDYVLEVKNYKSKDCVYSVQTVYIDKDTVTGSMSNPMESVLYDGVVLDDGICCVVIRRYTNICAIKYKRIPEYFTITDERDVIEITDRDKINILNLTLNL